MQSSHEPTEEKEENIEDGESSPSPSEEIKDDYPLLEMSVDNDSGKIWEKDRWILGHLIWWKIYLRP